MTERGGDRVRKMREHKENRPICDTRRRDLMWIDGVANRNASGGSTTQRIDHDEQLHERIIWRRIAHWLDAAAIEVADALVDLHRRLDSAEAFHLAGHVFRAHLQCDAVRQELGDASGREKRV